MPDSEGIRDGRILLDWVEHGKELAIMKERDMWIRIVDEVLKPAMPAKDGSEACLHLQWGRLSSLEP